jgi:GT2 family glycosyltransferase
LLLGEEVIFYGKEEVIPSLRKVCVVTVTYGKRWKLLREVLTTVISHHPAISDIIVVDNGSDDDIPGLVSQLGSDKIKVIRLKENTGSANGFKVGIEAALNTDAEFFWLLDDDNRPEQYCLVRLLRAYEALGEDPNNVLLSLRRDRKEYVEAVHEGFRVGIKANSFLGFHLKDVPQKIVRRLRKRRKTLGNYDLSNCRYPLISVGYAPYGGLLFHRSWVGEIGFPSEQFYVYSDDHEYTSRIIQHGGRIYLCAFSEVEDLEQSWHIKTARFHPLIDPSSNEVRLYYTTRNRVNLEITHYVKSHFIYRLNMLIYLSWLTFYGFVTFKSPINLWRRLKCLIRAIQHGLSGRLGIVEVLK